ncbi:MAG: HIT family protein [Myxococcota bacterium]|nr:HIT family protein [Myxococcota bacterium]
MTDCPFCAIAAGTGRGSIVYEDDLSIGLMDIFPVYPGHTLVVPRDHYDNLVACPDEVAAHLFNVAAKLGPAIMEVTGGTAFNVWTANGADAGQRVFHLHLHVLPRFPDDKFGLRFPKDFPRKTDLNELEEIAARIRSVVQK